MTNTGYPDTGHRPSVDAPYKLMRAKKGRMLGGVAAGLAQASGLDVTVVRICIGATMLSGLGIAAYILMCIVVPEEKPKRGQVIEPAPENTARIIRFTLVALAVLSALNQIGGFWPFDNARGHGIGLDGVVGTLLLAIGVSILLSRHRPDRNWWGEPAQPPASATPSTGPIATVTSNGLTPSGGIALVWARVLGWLALIWCSLLAIGVTALSRFGAVSLDRPVVLIVAWVVVFFAVLNTLLYAKFARAIIPALALLLIPAGIAAASVRPVGTVGEQIEHPESLTPRTHVYEHAAGALRLDFSDTAFDGDTKINARNGVGAIFVTVPNDAAVNVSTEVGTGSYKLFGRHRDFHVGSTETQRFKGCGGPKLTLTLRIGGGYIEVERANGAATCTEARPR